MELEARLRAFAAVARTSSFTAAAQALFVSQPAISKHIAALEAELGNALVVRNGRRTGLTPAGRVLADYVLRAEGLLANGRRAVSAVDDAQIGTLALAASGIPGTYLLPGPLTRFREQYGGVELDFRVSTSAEALELVRAHEVEIAVVGGMTLPDELGSDQLADDEIVLIGPPALAGRRLRPKDLEGLTWVTREEGSATRAAVDSERFQLGLREVRTLELPSWEAVKLAVADGAGIAAISRFALDVELAAGRLAVLDVPRWRVRRSIVVVTARDVPLTPPATRFLSLLRERYHADEEQLPPNSNLPAQPNPIIGRERDVEAITSLVRDGPRLVTLTGAGGSGKTRLALEVAGRLVNDFRDGVYLVELAAVIDPTLVAPTIARTLGADGRASLESVLADRRLLLVLDNFEQVRGAAHDVSHVLASAPALRVLVTSRAALRLRSEHRYAVSPLALEDAVELFHDRALAIDKAFEDDPAVAEICERLDRLPLALELAAARVAAFPPPVLLERLERRLPLLLGGARDLPARQRTIRRTIEWSYGLLESDAQRDFAGLAVFRGGWTFDGAEACGFAAGAIETLVEHNLVRRDGQRFSMLETVREFAEERFADLAERDELRRRHAEHFLSVAQEARSFARGPEAVAWLARTEAELDNIRAALAWSIDSDEGVLGLTLVEALEPYWYRRTQYREGLRWVEPLLELAPEAPAQIRAGALALAGRLASELGDVERAKAWYEQSLPLARAAQDREREAWSLHGLGFVSFREGHLTLARELLEQSMELFLALGQHAPAGGRLTYLAGIAIQQRDLPAAREYLERAHAEYEAASDEEGVAGALEGLGNIALEESDFPRACRFYGAALDVASDPRLLMFLFAGIAAVAASTRQPMEAARLWGAAKRIESELDEGLVGFDRPSYVEFLGTLDPPEIEVGTKLATSEAVTLARELVS